MIKYLYILYQAWSIYVTNQKSAFYGSLVDWRNSREVFLF
jgi:hypothetical protein